MPEIERVLVYREGDALVVFSVVADEDEDTLDRIYAVERALMHEFNAEHFDFNVISRRGRAMSDILESLAPVLQCRVPTSI